MDAESALSSTRPREPIDRSTFETAHLRHLTVAVRWYARSARSGFGFAWLDTERHRFGRLYVRRCWPKYGALEFDTRPPPVLPLRSATFEREPSSREARVAAACRTAALDFRPANPHRRAPKQKLPPMSPGPPTPHRYGDSHHRTAFPNRALLTKLGSHLGKIVVVQKDTQRFREGWAQSPVFHL